jgi:hypothetical protein
MSNREHSNSSSDNRLSAPYPTGLPTAPGWPQPYSQLPVHSIDAHRRPLVQLPAPLAANTIPNNLGLVVPIQFVPARHVQVLPSMHPTAYHNPSYRGKIPKFVQGEPYFGTDFSRIPEFPLPSGSGHSLQQPPRIIPTAVLPVPHPESIQTPGHAMEEGDEFEDIAADTAFMDYAPKKYGDGLPHPDRLVESQSLGAVDPPDIVYQLTTPREVMHHI